MRPAPKSKNRAHTGSMEIRAIWSYIDLTWRSNSVIWSGPNAFFDAATFVGNAVDDVDACEPAHQ